MFCQRSAKHLVHFTFGDKGGKSSQLFSSSSKDRELEKSCDDAQEALTAAKDAQAAARQGKKAGRNSSAVMHAIQAKAAGQAALDAAKASPVMSVSTQQSAGGRMRAIPNYRLFHQGQDEGDVSEVQEADSSSLTEGEEGG